MRANAAVFSVIFSIFLTITTELTSLAQNQSEIPFEARVVQLIEDSHQLRDWVENQPEHTWNTIRDSKLYTAAKFVGTIAVSLGCQSFVINPCVGRYIATYMDGYNMLFNCPPLPSISLLSMNHPDLSTICQPVTRLSAAITSALPVTWLINQKREWILNSVNRCTDTLVQGLIHTYYSCFSRKCPLQKNELIERILSNSEELLKKSHDLQSLPLSQRREIFHQASQNGQLKLMRAVLNEDIPSEKSVLDSLPNPEEDVCSICLDSFDVREAIPNALLERGCRHVFHETCFNEWTKRSETCALCRDSMRTEIADLCRRWDE